MRLTEQTKYGRTYKGNKGLAFFTLNMGTRDRGKYYSVAVSVNGEYKKLATRVGLEKALAMAEEAIDE